MTFQCFSRAIILAATSATFFSCSSQENTSDTASISDVVSMVRQADGTFQVHCADGSTEVRSESEVLANRVCLGSSGSTGNFVYGRSDSCSGDTIIASINEQTNCESLSQTTPAWSVKIDGQCRNISDTNARQACYFVQGSLPNTGTVYARSDSCSADEAIASITRYTNCDSLPDTGSAWSISVNGQCSNISDTTPRKACIEIKGNISYGGVIYGRSDSCSSDYALVWVDDFTDCNQYSTSTPAWSVKVNGECRNISDTSLRNACFIVQGG